MEGLWRDQAKRKVDLRGPEKRGDERNGVLKPQVSMHEVWKKQQVHEDARNMCRTKCWSFVENGESRS